MCSGGCDELLRQWELSVLSNRMKENGIDENALRDLTEKLISELIPEIGYRAAFLKHWRQHVTKSSAEFRQNIDPQTNDSSSDTDSISCSGQSESDLRQSGQSGSNLHQSDNELTRQNCFTGEDAFRRVQRCGVKQLLQKSIPGRLVLDAYRKTKQLTWKSRVRRSRESANEQCKSRESFAR